MVVAAAGGDGSCTLTTGLAAARRRRGRGRSFALRRFGRWSAEVRQRKRGFGSVWKLELGGWPFAVSRALACCAWGQPLATGHKRLKAWGFAGACDAITRPHMEVARSNGGKGERHEGAAHKPNHRSAAHTRTSFLYPTRSVESVGRFLGCPPLDDDDRSRARGAVHRT